MDATRLLQRFHIVPVVVINDARQAVPLAETLMESGIAVMEVTLRTDAALAAIQAIASKVPDMVVGAGSIRQPQHFADVKAAGAQFAVSPGASQKLIKAAMSNRFPWIPGAATPSEIIILLEQGYFLQKLFPAEVSGGMSFLKSVASPIPEVHFMPTGGISEKAAVDYLSLPNVSAVGGTWIAPSDLIADKNFKEIGRLAKNAAQMGMS